MIKTKNIIIDKNDIPPEWVFEYYLNLDEKLRGQSINILSCFNPNDNRPSMYIYYSSENSGYRFKDFSTGKFGDHTELVKQLFNLSSSNAFKKIRNDWAISGGDRKSTVSNNVKKNIIGDVVIRKWNTLDAEYWTKFKINSKILNQFNVKPLENFKIIDSDTKEIINTISQNYTYGFFRTDGSVYKIYRPMSKDYKFFSIEKYIHGVDQLTFTKKYLVICSSLKDMMAFTKLEYDNVEVIAPSSENSYIPNETIIAYKIKYKSMCTLFDNDVAGRKAALMYEKAYGIPGINLNMSKDLSDSLRDYSVYEVKKELTPLLREILK